MHSSHIEKLLRSVRKGSLSVEKALEKLKCLPYEDLRFAKVDHSRHLVQGVPEVILAQGKTTAEVRAIAKAMHSKSGRFLITKATRDIYRSLRIRDAVYFPASGVISSGGAKEGNRGRIMILAAGTSDIPVAEEAEVTASFMGSRVETAYDVGVAGIHRVLDRRDDLSSSRVIIVVAGMEGALPSVVGALSDKPIIAVPTSTGYGTSLGGLTALFAMLNSCVPGIAVMNIDNGFGAGCLAHKINTL